MSEPFHVGVGTVVQRNMRVPSRDKDDFNTAIWPGRSFRVMYMVGDDMVVLKMLPIPGYPGTVTTPERRTTITAEWFIPD